MCAYRFASIETCDILLDVLKLRIFGDTRVVFFNNSGQTGPNRPISRISPHQCYPTAGVIFKFSPVSVSSLPVGMMISGVTFTLRTAAVDTVLKLLNGVYCTGAAQAIPGEASDRKFGLANDIVVPSFTEGRLTDNQRAPIILHRGSKISDAGRTETIDQHHQRAFVVDHAVGVANTPRLPLLSRT